MPLVKLSISLEPRVADTMRRRASDLGKPASRYLSDLIEADARHARDALAAEGYRALSTETLAFAEEVLPLAGETWGA